MDGKKNIYKIIAVIIIAVFTIVLYPFVDDGKYRLMLIVMYLSPFLLVFFFPKIRKDETPMLLLIVSMFISGLYHFSTFRISTLLYSVLFITTFLLYRRLLFTGSMSVEFYLKLLKKIIYAYTIVLIVQQISTIIGFSVFNNWNPDTNTLRLNSLSLEPSHTGRIMLLLQFSFVSVKESYIKKRYTIRNALEDKMVWICYLYTVITCGSSIALISLCILFLYFFNIKKIFQALFISFGVAIVFLLFFDINTLFDINSFRRIYDLMPYILSLDVDNIIHTDLSASARIAPYFFYFQLLDVTSLDFWIGHGIDYSYNTIITMLLGHESDAGSATGGLFPAFFLDYGIIGGTIFLFGLKKMTMDKWFSFPMFMWVIVFSSNMFNTYIQWTFFIIMATTFYYKNAIAQSRSLKNNTL